MAALEFIIFFMLLTIVSSFFIVSFYSVTRHYIEVQPDGEEVIKGDLLKWYSYFIESIKRIDKVYYYGEQLSFKISELKRLLPQVGNKIGIDSTWYGGDKSFELRQNETFSDDDKIKIEAVLMCKIYQNGVYYFLYLEEPIYFLPSFIRKPLSSCVKCMASIFGSGFWLTINYLYNVFYWTDHKKLAFFIFWGIFIVILTKINEYIYHKINFNVRNM